MKYLFLDASENYTIAQTGSLGGYLCKTFATDRNLAARITNICDEMLAEAGFSHDQANLLAVCTGPGSLTGLRVAAAFLRTLALLLEKPLIGIDLFAWSLQTLADRGYTGPVRLVMPTLSDKAFEVNANLPDLNHSQPILIERTAMTSTIKTFGIRFQADGVEELQPAPDSLHKMLLAANNLPATGLNEILNVLPLYIIPSQAERKFKETQ